MYRSWCSTRGWIRDTPKSVCCRRLPTPKRRRASAPHRPQWPLAEIPATNPAISRYCVRCITNPEQISTLRVIGPPGGVPVNVVVVSNRVARAKPDEPLAGGLAAALLPMVRDSGAIWVGSSGQSGDGSRGSFARIESLGTGALATVDIPAKHYRGYYEGFANS